MQIEFVSYYGAKTQAMWLKNFISGLLIIDSISRSITIYCDNSAQFSLQRTIKSSSASNHIEINYLAVRDTIKKDDIFVEHINTKVMFVDPLTKGFRPVDFKRHVDNREF